PFNVVAESEAPDARPLRIPVNDSLALSGSLHLPDSGPPRGLILFFPELNGNHWMVRRYCEALIDQGYAILGFDFRNQGSSDSQPDYAPIHWLTEFEMEDVAAVVRFVEADPELTHLPLMAFGVSRGGAAALAASCRYPQIQTVISDSGFGTMDMSRHFVERFARLIIPNWIYMALPDWHIRLTLRGAFRFSEQRRQCRYVHIEQEVRRRTPVPVLLISGTRDSYVTPNISRQLQATLGPATELWLVEQAKHNMARAKQREQYDALITEHVARIFGAAELPAATKSAPLKNVSVDETQDAAVSR
ncbi:MAG: alpha/beta fold hydrolase, partial [Planctomycetaceae bacterium]|nr:alpha/beta fold hydrolase [Planctomycetaceae bacterium]